MLGSMSASPSSFRHPVLLAQEHLLRGLARLHWRLQGDDKAAHRQRVGEAGERAAYFFLRRQGYVVVAQRWRSAHDDGEVDLIAWHNDTLCFVEVKTRTAEDRFAPEYAVNAGKQKALRRMARAYVHGLPWVGNERAEPQLRFDVVTVYLEGASLPRIEHLPGYF